MSFILSCDFWFCCGSANDDPVDRYRPPPPPSSQTQIVAVVQQTPPVQEQPSHHQMPPHLVAPPPLAPAMGYAMPPPHQATPYWPHVPPTISYDPPFPVTMRPPSSPAPTAMLPPPPQAVPPRRVPSKSHDPFLPFAETTSSTTPSHVSGQSTKADDNPSPPAPEHPAQAPWPTRQPSKKAAIQQDVPCNKVPSKRYNDENPAPGQTPARTTSVVHDISLRSTLMVLPSRVPSMKTKQAYDEPTPAPVVPSSQRPPQATWPTRQPSNKTYQTQLEPPQMSYDTRAPAVMPQAAEDLPPANSMAPRAPATSSEPLNHYI